MKILTIVCDLEKGGTQRAAQIFAEAYHKIGHDSRVLALYGLGSRYDEIRDKIKVWHKISDDNLREMEQWSSDLIHIHSHGPSEKDINKILDHLKNDRVKVIEQNVFSKPSPWAKRVDVSFQFSNWALWLYDMRGGRKFKTAIVPNPVVCDKFYHRSQAEVEAFKSAYNIPKDAFVIGRIGQAYWGKWSLMLLDAFNRLAKDNSNFYLVVVNPTADILDEITKSPFRDRIVHIPVIHGDDALSVAYSSFDLMVHISEKGESFGYVLAESILCGTPVVTLSTPWADNSQCEVVGNMKGGYVVNDLDGVVRAVEYYFNNPDKHEGLKKMGREHIYNNYDYLKLANKAIGSVSGVGDGVHGELADIKKINAILEDTFDKTGLLAILLMKTNILFFRRFTLYKYPMRILLPVVFKKIMIKLKLSKTP